jgi:hypothetical protein
MSRFWQKTVIIILVVVLISWTITQAIWFMAAEESMHTCAEDDGNTAVLDFLSTEDPFQGLEEFSIATYFVAPAVGVLISLLAVGVI